MDALLFYNCTSHLKRILFLLFLLTMNNFTVNHCIISYLFCFLVVLVFVYALCYEPFTCTVCLGIRPNLSHASNVIVF